MVTGATIKSMDKDIDTSIDQEVEFTSAYLQKQIEASLGETLPDSEDQPEEPKKKRGRPRKEDKAKADEVGELPDVTEQAQEVREDDSENEDEPEERVISVEDIPEDQRLDAANAIIEILSQEQKDALLDKVGEGVSAELKALRDTNKALEAKVAEVEKKSRSQIDKIISPNSYFADVNTESELDEKEKNIRANLDYYDDLIDSTDEVFLINNKEYTREQVRGFRNQYRKIAEDAREHRYRIREVSKYRERYKETVDKLSSKYDWYSDESSDKRKAYDSVASEIDLEHLKYVAPKSAALLPSILAQYVSAEQKDEGARRIFKLPIKQTKPNKIRIASGGSVLKTETDPISEIKNKTASGELTKNDLLNAVARSL